MYSADRSGPVSDGPIDMGEYRAVRESYPNFQDELGSWLSSLTGIHVSKKGVSVGGGLAKLPSVTLVRKSAPAPMAPMLSANLIPAPVGVGGLSSTALLLGGAALVAVLMLRGRRS